MWPVFKQKKIVVSLIIGILVLLLTPLLFLFNPSFIPSLMATTTQKPTVTQPTSPLPGRADGQEPMLNCSPTTTQATDQQLRAAWIATVVNVDWPSRKGLSAAVQQQEFIRLLDELKRMNMNAAIVQIKPTADAFYPSKYAPWSEYLTGEQGKNPGYDPLAFMLKEAHQRNLEFHAWVNPYRISMQGDITKLVPDHPARKHSDWVVSYGGKLYFDPGIPQARQFITESILEAVTNYEIDAVHMDDYFYPYPIAGQDFPDEETYQRYGASRFPNKSDWRRDNVNQLVKELSQAIKKAKPSVKFGISPFGVWRNQSTDPTGSETRAGIETYDDLYADTRTWIRSNWLDYVAPQIYWNIGFPAAAYDKLVDWWSKEVDGRNVHLYIGQAAYKVNASTPEWANPEEMPNQLKLNLRSPQVKGSIFFSIKDLLKNPLGLKDRLINDLYRNPARIPPMPWLPQKNPSASSGACPS